MWQKKRERKESCVLDWIKKNEYPKKGYICLLLLWKRFNSGKCVYWQLL